MAPFSETFVSIRAFYIDVEAVIEADRDQVSSTLHISSKHSVYSRSNLIPPSSLAIYFQNHLLIFLKRKDSKIKESNFGNEIYLKAGGDYNHFPKRAYPAWILSDLHSIFINGGSHASKFFKKKC